MKTVLHVIDSLRLGGAEALVTALVRRLDETDLSRNVVVSTLGHADPGLVADLRAHAAEVRLTDAQRLADGRLLRAVGAVARAHEVDVVHSHLSSANVSSRIAAALTSRRHVTTLHTMPGPTAEDSPLHAALDGWTGRLSRIIVAPAPEIADAYSRAYRIPSKRFRVIPNAPAAPRPGPGYDRAAVRHELLRDADGPLVVCVARLQAEKGIDELIEAVALLAGEHPGLRVAVAGAGPEEDRLRALAVDRGVAGRLELLGRRSDIGDLLAAADAFCLPSRHEGLPLSVLEAMDARLPVIVTAVGGLPGLITDGETGLIVPARDPAALAGAFRRLLADPALAERVAAGGHELLRRSYSLDAVARRYAEVYEEAVRRA